MAGACPHFEDVHKINNAGVHKGNMWRWPGENGKSMIDTWQRGADEYKRNIISFPGWISAPRILKEKYLNSLNYKSFKFKYSVHPREPDFQNDLQGPNFVQNMKCIIPLEPRENKLSKSKVRMYTGI